MVNTYKYNLSAKEVASRSVICFTVPKCTTNNKETSKRKKKREGKTASPTGILYFDITERVTSAEKPNTFLMKPLILSELCISDST